jgi:hypothetical protein
MRVGKVLGYGVELVLHQHHNFTTMVGIPGHRCNTSVKRGNCHDFNTCVRLLHFSWPNPGHLRKRAEGIGEMYRCKSFHEIKFSGWIKDVLFRHDFMTVTNSLKTQFLIMQ